MVFDKEFLSRGAIVGVISHANGGNAGRAIENMQGIVLPIAVDRTGILRVGVLIHPVNIHRYFLYTTCLVHGHEHESKFKYKYMRVYPLFS